MGRQPVAGMTLIVSRSAYTLFVAFPSQSNHHGNRIWDMDLNKYSMFGSSLGLDLQCLASDHMAGFDFGSHSSSYPNLLLLGLSPLDRRVSGRLLRVDMALCRACRVFWQVSLLLAMSSRSVITSEKRSSCSIGSIFFGLCLRRRASYVVEKIHKRQGYLVHQLSKQLWSTDWRFAQNPCAHQFSIWLPID